MCVYIRFTYTHTPAHANKHTFMTHTYTHTHPAHEHTRTHDTHKYTHKHTHAHGIIRGGSGPISQIGVYLVDTRIQGGSLGFLLEYQGGSIRSSRSLPWRRRVLVTAVTSVRRSDRLRSVADWARLDVQLDVNWVDLT